MNSILSRQQQYIVVALTVILSLGIVWASVLGASTISTNISTDGTLTVAGATTLNTVAYTWPSADGSSGNVLSTDGAGVLSWAAGGGSGTVNSGTTGQFPYYAGAGTALTATSSIFISTAGNIGIGSATPKDQFQIGARGTFHSASVIGTLLENNLYYDGTNYRNIGTGSGSNIRQTGGVIYFQTASSGAADAIATVSERMRISLAGNIGIGSTSPTSLLSLSSTATTTIDLGTTQSATNGSCIQMYSPSGTAVRLYINNANTLVTEVGSCKDN